MTDLNPPTQQRSENMRRVRSKNTKPELRVRSALHKAGFRFRLHRRDLPGSPDIVLTRYRVAVWVNGCFWHAHDCRRGRSRPSANAQFWKDKIESTKARDLRGLQNATAAGWTTWVVWECCLEAGIQELVANLRSEQPNLGAVDS